VQEIRAQSGYQQYFTALTYNPANPKDWVLNHKLRLEPLVDVYRLNYFPVVYRRNQQTFTGWATFYLYNENEARTRFTAPDNRTTSVEIQPTNPPFHRILWTTLLDRYGVKYDDNNLLLEDLVTDFWDAFLAKPNDGFDPSQYGESLWFQKCCDDERKVGDVRKELDHLYFKMVPEKIAFFPSPLLVRLQDQAPPVELLETQVRVTHYDFDTLGLRLVTPAFYPPELLKPSDPNFDPLDKQIPDVANELKVMVLLKV